MFTRAGNQLEIHVQTVLERQGRTRGFGAYVVCIHVCEFSSTYDTCTACCCTWIKPRIKPSHDNVENSTLTVLSKIRIGAGDVDVKLVVIPHREYGSIHLPQVMDVVLRDVTKGDFPPT